jgi:hypothetical protein
LTESYVFHIRNAPPEDLAVALTTIERYPGLSTVSDIVERAEMLGFTVRDRQRFEALITARDLGLVRPEQNRLTSKGTLAARLELLKPDLFVDIIHGLLYTLWNPAQKDHNCFSWSYRAICKTLWNTGNGSLPGRRELASIVETEAQTVFPEARIAFSSKSVGGALLWISSLAPPVLDEEETHFARRGFCAPELLILAIDFVYRSREIDYGANLLLNDKNKETICQACLLETDRFERVLEYAVAQFNYVHKGIGGGWGQYLALDRAPTLEEFV